MNGEIAPSELLANSRRLPAAPSAAQRHDAVHRAIAAVCDPEIPMLSVIDLGIIANVRIQENRVEIDVTPTFVGCPAVDLIRRQLHDAVLATGETEVTVNLVHEPAWTSDRITELGRRKLTEFGIAPPGPRHCGHGDPALDHTPCPFCGSVDTQLESIFGPTLCRSIHYCAKCLQSFEHFKPL